MRVIARLNVGGATIQAISLTKLLEPAYRTTLLRGTEGPREGDMQHLVDEYGIEPVFVPGLARELGVGDLRALLSIRRALRRERPMILHTHTAKAGTLGRVAALFAGSARPPVIVHTFHGHVLEGYFSPLKSKAFAWIERLLARTTSKLVVVSDEVRDDLVRLKVAPRDRIEVVALGFNLKSLVLEREERAHLRENLREELRIPADAPLVTLVGRLVPIKRVDRFLRMAEHVAANRDNVRFLIVGDGERREELESSPAARNLEGRIVWAGFRRDLPAIYSASDVVALTSDNEGTPVSLIEAQAAGVPVVATDVGGTRSVVEDGISGRIAPAEAEAELAEAVVELLDDRDLVARLTDAGRESALARFDVARLVDDVDRLYRELLASASGRSRSRSNGS